MVGAVKRLRQLRARDVVELHDGFEFEGRALSGFHCEVVSVLNIGQTQDLLLEDPFGFPVLATFPVNCDYFGHLEVTE